MCALGRGGGGQLLLEEHEEERFLEFGRSKDGRIVTLNASTKTSSEASSGTFHSLHTTARG